MKRTLLLTLICALLLTGCALLPGYSEDKLFAYMPEHETKEFYTNGTFQDYTDYGIYTYKPFDYEQAFSGTRFSKAASADCIELLSYIDDFESWVAVADENNELYRHYNFDRSIISEGDYLHIYDKEGEPIGKSYYRKFANYSIYFFDSESYTMYYFHNNI